MNATVLVVDDDAAVLELTGRFLSRNGFNVLTCDSAASALARFNAAEHNIDLLIADLELPDSSGIEIATQFKALAPGIKTLFVSGYSIEDLEGAHMAVVNQSGDGSVGFLRKPYSGKELLERVRQLLADPPATEGTGTDGEDPIKPRYEGAYDTLEGQAGLLELVHDAIIVHDLNGRIQYWNHAAETLYGWSKREAIGLVASELLHTVFPKPIAEIMTELRTTHCWEGELHQIGRDGDMVVVSARWGFREIGNDRIEILELNRDITAQKKMEEGFLGVNREMQFRLEELRRAEKMSRALLESAPDAMVITDRSGSIVLINAQAEKQFGYSREEMLGQSVEMLVPKRFRDGHSGLRAGYMREPYVRPMGEHSELFGLRKDGEEFPVEISLSAIETGTGLLISSAIRDITVRKRLAQEARARRIREGHE